MRTMTMIAVSVAVSSVATTALSRAELQCNKLQTKCVAENNKLTIGDQVGIFNEDGELVATGEVNAMRGERRAVQIDKRHGTIRRNYKLAMMDDKSSSANLTPVKIYRDP